jgi:hypothetical protein
LFYNVRLNKKCFNIYIFALSYSLLFRMWRWVALAARGAARLSGRGRAVSSTSPPADTAVATAAPASVDAASLVAADLRTMFKEIHLELDVQVAALPNKISLAVGSDDRRQLVDMAKYYFDGEGKAVRPVLAMVLGHAYNRHFGMVQPEVTVLLRLNLVIQTHVTLTLRVPDRGATAQGGHHQ